MGSNKHTDDALEELLELLELLRPPESKSKPPKTLTAAAYHNDMELVKKFLVAGFDVNEKARRGSPLGYAVVNGNLALVNLLLEAGARNPGSSLPTAAENGHLAIVRRLFEVGVDFEKDGSPALAIAAYRNQVEAVKLLLEKGVRPEANNFHAVNEAARHASIEVLRLFFGFGIKPEQLGAALRIAACSPLAFKAVKFLVEAGVDPRNHPDYAFDFNGVKKDKPLLPADAAAQHGKTEIADYLNGKPIDEQALLDREETLRKSWDTSGMGEMLLEDAKQKTAHLLRGAARVEGIRRAIVLAHNQALKPRINDQGRGERGDTVLGLASANGDVEMVAALLEAGANPTQHDKSGETPLYHAAANGHTHVVKVLLRAGAAPNHTGCTALIEAADWDDPEMVKMLLDAGANPNIKADSGQSFLNVEFGLHAKEIKALLRAAVNKKSGGRAAKDGGLKFVRRKKMIDLAIVFGVQDFRSWYYSSQPEWSVAMVRAPLAEVAHTYAGIVKSSRWETDIAGKQVRSAKRGVFLLQLKDSAWTIILRSLGWLDEEGITDIEHEARELSSHLKTRTYTYLADDTSGAEAYQLYESGQLLEKACHCDGFTFESRLRKQPKFNSTLFPDPVFADEEVYLPACYPEDDGLAAKLVVEGLKPGDVARADYIVLSD